MSPLLLSISGFLLGCVALLLSWHNKTISKKRIEELQRRTLQAQRDLKHIGTLANEVAHEIKNPITAILCSAETIDLLIGKDIDPMHQKSLKYIKEYGDQLLGLVSDFLDISRAETGNMSVQPTAQPVARVVRSVVGLLESNAITKKIDIKITILDESLEAYVDPKHFKQILFNLVHNAIKFTPEKGEIKIVVRQDYPHPRLKIAVRDNGAGMNNREANELFNPYRGKNSEQEGGGAGLGLSLCKSLVGLNSGELTVASSLGVGSSFEFSLPLAKKSKDQNSNQQEFEPENKPLLGQSFLVVDEHTGSREAVSKLLEALGGMVDRVSLAADALDAISGKTYDAVMIDDEMDGVYGHELATLLRDQIGNTEETTVIVASDSNVEPDIAEYSGADLCIEKPINCNRLLSSLVKSGKCSVTH